MPTTGFPSGISVRDDGRSLSLADLADVEITDPRDGDVLTLDAGVWVNRQPAAA